MDNPLDDKLPHSFLEAQGRLVTIQSAFQEFMSIISQIEGEISIEPRRLHALLYPIEAEMEATVDEMEELALFFRGLAPA